MLLWTLLFTNAFPTTKEMTTNLLSMHTTMSIRKKRLLGKTKKNDQPKNNHNFSPLIHTTTSIRKMFPKKRKEKTPPSYIMFQVIF